jgi:hypothetical protein
MKKYGVLAVILALALCVHLQLAGFADIDAAVLSEAINRVALADTRGVQTKQAHALDMIVLFNGDANGVNGQDEDEKNKEDEEPEGFDRLWDVVLYG